MRKDVDQFPQFDVDTATGTVKVTVEAVKPPAGVRPGLPRTAYVGITYRL